MFFAPNTTDFPKELSHELLQFFSQHETGLDSFLKSAGHSLKNLWEALAKNRGQNTATKHYSLDAKQARAYAAYYLPANLLKIALILEEMRLLRISPFQRQDLEKITWADLGCGPGTLSAGLLWWLKTAEEPALKKIPFDFWNLDQSNHFLELSQKLLSHLRGAWGVGTEKKFFTELQNAKKEPVFRWLQDKKPTVVSLMNSWAELSVLPQERTEWLLKLTEQLHGFSKVDGKPRWLILIEPGTQVHSRELLQAREKLKSQAGVEVLLPCFGARPCGALLKESDWCHEEARILFPDWHDKLGAQAELKKEQLLFSYLVLRIGAGAKNSSEAWAQDMVRCVSQRLEQKGSTECYLCTSTGKTRARVLHSKANALNEYFLNVARGDLFDSVKMDAKGTVESFSKLKV